MSSWVFSLTISTIISLTLLKTNGPWINTDREYVFTEVEQFSPCDYICKFLVLYLACDKPITFDYTVHHFVNLWGIVWVYYQNNYFGFVKNILFYEMSTPWLSMYMITKNKWFVPYIVLTFFYYRIYTTLVLFKYFLEVDAVLKIVNVSNMLLNLYWFSKICRKCYVKLLQ